MDYLIPCAASPVYILALLYWKCFRLTYSKFQVITVLFLYEIHLIIDLKKTVYAKENYMLIQLHFNTRFSSTFAENNQYSQGAFVGFVKCLFNL